MRRGLLLRVVLVTVNLYPLPSLAQEPPAIPTRRLEPSLPTPPYRYSDILPKHFTNGSRPDNIAAADNTPSDNPTTDNGAVLGRVLFYDTRLSINDRISCGSCHQQRYGFSDSRRLSLGFDGQLARRHTMSLTNARYYAPGRFAWDERGETLETIALAPIRDSIEMGLSLDILETKIATTPFYPPLFKQAFGTPIVTRNRVAQALAQFVRALVSYRSPYDAALSAGPAGSPAFIAHLTPAQRLGYRLFTTDRNSEPRGGGCSQCHITDAQISLTPRNIGLSAGTDTDDGAGDGRFKAPSLRNIAVSGPYMHDGRFSTLREVIDHYNSAVAADPFLDMRLLDRRLAVTGGPVQPVRLELSELEITGLLSFLEALTDVAFLTDPRFSDPFALADSQP